MDKRLQPGETLEGQAGQYRIERELGSGGFGVTYLAKRVADEQPVALKRLYIGRVKEWKNIELFQREVAVLRRLEHPHIPRYIDHFSAGGEVLVQEYVEGHDLAAVVRGEQSLDQGQLVSCLGQILEVLDYLHQLTPPVLHRDVKPGNIILRTDGQAFLVDFGAVRVGMGHTMASTTAGTFGYAPMEQFVGQAFPASDLYGLGMSFVSIAAGRAPSDLPFRGMRVDIGAVTNLDARLELLLTRLTEPDPERRLGDARIALEQLRPLRARYGHSGIAATSMAAVAQAHRSAHSARGRAAIASDDLLPSEQLREAAARRALLGEDALDVPVYEDVLDDFDTDARALDPAGAFIGLQDHLIDLEQMAVQQKLDLPRSSFGDPGLVLALGPGAQTVVGADDSSFDRTVCALTRSGDSWTTTSTIQTRINGALEVSPDGRSLLLFGESKGTALYDLGAGTLSQRFAGDWEGGRFHPGGGALALFDHSYRSQILSAEGGTTKLEGAECLAWSPDGRTLALFSDRAIKLRAAEKPSGRNLKVLKGLGSSWRSPRFSPDGRWLAAFDYSKDMTVVIDLAKGALLHRFSDPGRPGGTLSSFRGLGFSADGSRLLVAADMHCNRFATRKEDIVGVWALPEGRYLGALMREEKGGRPAVVAASGFYGRLPPVGRTDAGDGQRGSGKGKGRSKGKGSPSPWNRPEVARRALRGLPIDELLDERDRARLADLEARWAWLSDLRSEGKIEQDAALVRLLGATQGLGHVLDLVLRQALEARSQVSTFGTAPDAAALTGDQMVAAGEAIRALPPETLAARYELLLAEAEEAELNRARALAETKPARSQRALNAPNAPNAPALRGGGPPVGRGGALLRRGAAVPATVEPSRRKAVLIGVAVLILMLIATGVWLMRG